MTGIRPSGMLIVIAVLSAIVLTGCATAGLVRVQQNSPLDTVATKQVDAVCPDEKKVVGGGYLFFLGGPTVPIRTNAPLQDLSGWRVSATNRDNTAWSVSAVAICADATVDE